MSVTTTLHQFVRRIRWVVDGLTVGKLLNVVAAGLGYLLKKHWSSPWPIALKIDISPACNLKCPVCVHADPGDDALLQQQNFSSKRMSVAHFRSIIDEVQGNVSAVSLYYVGDPYAHPHVDEMCRIASDAGLNVHLSSNFSFRFTDARIRSIVESGVSHLTVCVDGLSQETYGRTRIKGRLDFVLSNVERVCRVRRELGSRFPRVEVQFIKFPHNVHELEPALAWFNKIGVDSVEHSWGMVSNYVALDPSRYTIGEARKSRALPLCHWPYNSMVIRYDGEVVPCCNFRHATQYVPGENVRSLGNVVSSGVKQIWNSERYRQLRRDVANPKSHAARMREEEHFCYGCPALFVTTQSDNIKMAPDFDVSGNRVIPIAGGSMHQRLNCSPSR